MNNSILYAKVTVSEKKSLKLSSKYYVGHLFS